MQKQETCWATARGLTRFKPHQIVILAVEIKAGASSGSRDPVGFLHW